MTKKINRYSQMEKAHKQEMDDFAEEHVFFAFDHNDLEEGCRRWGIPTSEASTQLVSIGAGGYIRRTDFPLWLQLLARQSKEVRSAMDDDKTGEGFIFEGMLNELVGQHDWGYADEDEVLEHSDLKITPDMMRNDPRMKRAYNMVCDYMEEPTDAYEVIEDYMDNNPEFAVLLADAAESRGEYSGGTMEVWNSDFFDTYFRNDPEEAARATFFGDIRDWPDDYISIDGAGNLYSCSARHYQNECLSNRNSLIKFMLKHPDDVAIPEDLQAEFDRLDDKMPVWNRKRKSRSKAKPRNRLFRRMV